jgi:serine/threonine protein phosphatase PrpC
MPTPMDIIRVQRSGSAAFACGVAEMHGHRLHHEDAHEMTCRTEVRAADFWVLDGHGSAAAAIYSAPELVREQCFSSDQLPEDCVIERTFESVDQRLRDHVKAVGGDALIAGSTVIGALVAQQSDGTYALKLANCGDSRGVVVYGPSKCTAGNAASSDGDLADFISGVTVRRPSRFTAEHETCKSSWPLICDTWDHKPDDPVELARIEAAGGFVTPSRPPRLDGVLAVSRALGDFTWKSDSEGAAAHQKVSCVPDIYEVTGLPAGALLILACDGIWDVMTSTEAATFIRDHVSKDSFNVDLGKIAADLVRECLRRGSTDNMTAMVVHFADGSKWCGYPDELVDFKRFAVPNPCEVQPQYAEFLNRCGVSPGPPEPDASGRWFIRVGECPCVAAAIE